MSSTYSGDAAFPLLLTIPGDGDDDGAASVNIPVEGLANRSVLTALGGFMGAAFVAVRFSATDASDDPNSWSQVGSSVGNNAWATLFSMASAAQGLSVDELPALSVDLDGYARVTGTVSLKTTAGRGVCRIAWRVSGGGAYTAVAQTEFAIDSTLRTYSINAVVPLDTITTSDSAEVYDFAIQARTFDAGEYCRMYGPYNLLCESAQVPA